MFLIGLTGGIASGKSTVARRLVEHGAFHLDADEFARRAVAPGSPALERIADRFGRELIDAHGELDRKALGALVFDDPTARAELEAIVHPEVKAAFAEAIARIAAEAPDAVVVYDVPLLVEAASDHPYDLVVVTQAGRDAQLQRLTEERGLEVEHAEHRINAQASDAERAERADVVIDTSGSLAHTMSQVDALWLEIKRRAGH